MYSIFYWFYNTFGYLCKICNNRLISFLFRCSIWLCNKYFNKFMVMVYKQRKKIGVTKVKRQQKVIASLTSYPARINTVWIAIETILSQSVKADEVLLWLADSQFPNGLENLPKELLAQTERGLTIRFCEDLRSHKKYYNALKEFPKDILIIFDDDMFYPKNCIKALLKLYKKAPDHIICTSSSVFYESNIMNPIGWEQNLHKVIGAQNLGINGCSGTLYPPGAFYNNVFEKENLKKFAFQADDLWLTAAAYMKGTKLASLRYRPFPFPIHGSQKESLFMKNNFEFSEINNNTQWRDILIHYKVELKEWLSQYGIDSETEL